MAHDHHSHAHATMNDTVGREQAGRVKDPVCGMWVDPATAKNKAERRGATFYFCSARCREKFVGEPARYMAAAAELLASQPEAQPKAAPAAAIYTCPMHPEIRRTGPGSCPICGMALEPEVATAAEEGPSAELIDMTRRFRIALALSIPVVALEMGGHLINLPMWLSEGLANWIQSALATPVVLWAGWPFFERGWTSLKTRSLNMFTLIAMGTGVAWTYSVVATLRAGHFPGGVSKPGRLGRGLFRSCRSHYHACAVGTGA